MVLEDFSFDAPKTKSYKAMLDSFKAGDKKTLLVMPEPNKNVILSARNLENADVTVSTELNTYKILDAKCLIITEKALEGLTATFNA